MLVATGTFLTCFPRRSHSMLLELVELPDLAPDYVAAPPRWFRPFWMFCSVKNASTGPIFIYGPRHASARTRIPTSLFVLPPGRRTPAFWDCKGIFVPTDCVVHFTTGTIQGAIAVKYRDLRWITVRGSKSALFCRTPDGILRSDQNHFPVPHLTAKEVSSLAKQWVWVP